jgi:hypothetical protein
MGDKHQEKLSLIQDLIALSEADGNRSFMEENFILSVASSLGVSAEEVEHIKNNPIAYSPEDKETDRIIQFYRLLLLLGVDPEKTAEEINCCKEIALKMGLNPIAVNKTIEQILNSETGMLPPATVISIFQVQHN